MIIFVRNGKKLMLSKISDTKYWPTPVFHVQDIQLINV